MWWEAIESSALMGKKESIDGYKHVNPADKLRKADRAKENKRNKLENEKRKEIQSFRQDPQVLLAKIEALESGKEGSGYEVQKKIQEYKDAYDALKRIKRREEAEMKLGAAQRAERCSVLPAHIVARARLVKQMAHERQHTVNRDDSSDDSSDMPSYHASDDEGSPENDAPAGGAAAAAPPPAAATTASDRNTGGILPNPPSLPASLHGLQPPLPQFTVRPPPPLPFLPPPPPPQALLWREAKAADGRSYYYNTVTKETSWTKPPEMHAAAAVVLPPPPPLAMMLQGMGRGGGFGPAPVRPMMMGAFGVPGMQPPALAMHQMQMQAHLQQQQGLALHQHQLQQQQQQQLLQQQQHQHQQQQQQQQQQQLLEVQHQPQTSDSSAAEPSAPACIAAPPVIATAQTPAAALKFAPRVLGSARRPPPTSAATAAQRAAAAERAALAAAGVVAGSGSAGNHLGDKRLRAQDAEIDLFMKDVESIFGGT